MKREIVFVILCLFYLSGCKNSSHYLKISDYKIKENALKNFEPVRVLFVGPSKKFTENRDYYNQIIVVSMIDGDTINVLYADDPDFNENDSDKQFYFVDPEHIVKAVSLSAIALTQDSATIRFMHDAVNDTAIHSYSIGEYSKVMINPEYIGMVKNNYPTLFGKVVRDTAHILPYDIR